MSQLALILRQSRDRVLFADADLAQIILGSVREVPSLRAVVLLSSSRQAPEELPLPAGTALWNYEDLLAASDDGYSWPGLDENTASTLWCTQDAHGSQQCMLYSNRVMVLHVFAANVVDAFGLRTVDRALLVAPADCAVGQILPYCATMAGAALILPGRGRVDGAHLLQMLDAERVTFAAGPPEVWWGMLRELRRTGISGPRSLERVHIVGNSDASPALIRELRACGVEVRCDDDMRAALLTPGP